MNDLYNERIDAMKARERCFDRWSMIKYVCARQVDDQDARNTNRLAAYKRKRADYAPRETWQDFIGLLAGVALVAGWFWFLWLEMGPLAWG